MKTKRRFILASAAALPALAMAPFRKSAVAGQTYQIKPMGAPAGPSAAYFPNVPVVDHLGREYLWYDDIIRHHSVMINFFTSENDDEYGITDNLIKTQELAEARGIKNMTFISVSADALSGEELARYVARKQIRGNWLFITGTHANIDLMRAFLFMPKGSSRSAAGLAAGYGFEDEHDCSLSVIRYGNEALGRWASFPALTKPEGIVLRFPWVEPSPGQKKS